MSEANYKLIIDMDTYIRLFIVNPKGSTIHQYYKKSLKNAINGYLLLVAFYNC